MGRLQAQIGIKVISKPFDQESLCNSLMIADLLEGHPMDWVLFAVVCLTIAPRE